MDVFSKCYSQRVPACWLFIPLPGGFQDLEMYVLQWQITVHTQSRNGSAGKKDLQISATAGGLLLWQKSPAFLFPKHCRFISVQQQNDKSFLKSYNHLDRQIIAQKGWCNCTLRSHLWAATGDATYICRQKMMSTFDYWVHITDHLQQWSQSILVYNKDHGLAIYGQEISHSVIRLLLYKSVKHKGWTLPYLWHPSLSHS